MVITQLPRLKNPHRPAGETNMNKMYRLISETSQPVAAQFALTFVESSEAGTKKAAKARGRTYRTVSSASRNGMARKHIVPAINTALKDGLYAAASADLSSATNRLKEQALQNAIRTYLSAA